MIAVRPLTPAFAAKARDEFGEDPQLLEAGLRELKEWIAEQPHLRARTDDQWLAAFLRGCKFRLDQTKRKIDLYYALRSTAPDLYPVQYNHSKLMDLLDMGGILILPKVKNPTDPRIVILKQGCYNPKEYTVFELMTLSSLLHQICFMEDENVTVSGVRYVVDLANLQLGHYTQASLKQIRNLVRAHQLNTYTTLDGLYDHIPKELLPEEYGGTCGTVQEIKDHWKRRFIEYSDFYEEDLKYGTDEDKRGSDLKSTY